MGNQVAKSISTLRQFRYSLPS